MTRVEFAESDVQVSFEVNLGRYRGAEEEVLFRLQKALRKAVADEMALAAAALGQSLDKPDVAALTRFSEPFYNHDTDWAQVIADCRQKEAERKAQKNVSPTGGL